MRVIHPFKPIYNQESTLLILGSFPSIKSRQNNFYYGNPQNRFWKILENIFDDKIQNTTKGKIEFLYKHHIALWDVVKSCDIIDSSDSSIRNVETNDIINIIKNTDITTIYCNGNTSYKLFIKYFKDKIADIPIIVLPSSSPANARYSLKNLTNIWKEKILKT